MQSLLKLLAAATLLSAAACADQTAPTEPLAPESGAMEEHLGRWSGPQDVTVMSQNLYVGADVDAVITALATPDPDDDIPALLDAVATLERTDFPARAAAIAREIGRRHPLVVGLQEVSTIGIDIPPLGVSVHLDFQQLLLDALAAQGLNYVVAVRLDNFIASPAPGISLTDADIMLVDPSFVEVVTTAGHTFAANLGVVAPGVDLQRGWVEMTAVIDGVSYTFASTHTEGTGPDELLLQLHAAQVGELAASLGDAAPVIVMGDFNARPGSPAYQVMLDAGFTDVWHALRPGVRGYTCCQLADLSNPRPMFSERIDYVWTRGLGSLRGRHSLLGQVGLFGDVPSDRIRNGAGDLIWPSDHAGVIANIMLPRRGPST
ncbi:MAG TPA: endonuclease/exonuclease/phosphatase family protein [Gemmatimonadales bacterium]|nr:endonuclease/exonuclease/phosphatase family protein [Gemmatimonadales bacterium]